MGLRAHTTIGVKPALDCTLLDVVPLRLGTPHVRSARVAVSCDTSGQPMSHAGPQSNITAYGQRFAAIQGHWRYVIGSGSVVTKDTPKVMIAVGNPCRVLREVVKKS